MAESAKPETHVTKPDGNGEVVLRVVDVSKKFGRTHAVRSATLEILPGEVHALVGEDGSGKSTLVKILSGVHRPDSGQLTIFGAKECSALRSPREAMAIGLGTVFQEVLAVEARSVLENVWLGSEGLFRSERTGQERRQLAERVLAELIGEPPDLDLPIGRLSLSERQACGVSRVLLRTPRVLILDEATSALDIATRDRLFVLLREFVATGGSVIFISHRMDEIREIADRVTVMRSGETVGTLVRDEVETPLLLRMMTGSDDLALVDEGVSASKRAKAGPGEVLVELDQVKIGSGEIVGLAGLEGQGQERFLWALREAAGSAGAYVPRDRRSESIFESKSVLENFSLPTLGQDTSPGLVRPRRSASRLRGFTEKLQIKFGRADDQIVTLSGGNQQKVVIARWLATDPKILLLNDPTRGVDLGAKRDLYRLLVELAGQGTAIVMLSTEIDEHLELMDRVLVFYEGSLRVGFERENLSRQGLVAGYFGREGDDA